jgi:hypothetical protein
MRAFRRASIAGAVVVIAGLAAPMAAAPVKIFRAQSAQQFLTGTFEGISVDPLGALRLADRADRVAALDEPFLLAAAAHPRGWVVGTGNAGRVLLVDRSGKTSVLFQASEPEVFAVWSDADGTVFAGTSPQGKVYRIANGKSEVWFEPGETYIWGIQRAADGSLLVGTGTQGRLYKVTGKGAGKVFYDSDDTHVRALQVLASGDVLLGTAGEGLVLRVDSSGRARTLYDSDKPEIVGFAVAPDGTAYTAALQSEAGLVGQAEAQSRGGKGEKSDSVEKEDGKDEAQAVVTVTAEGENPAASPAAHGQRSEVLRIAASGVVESLWSFDNETVYALSWQRGRLWVGTGLDGKLYSLQDGRMILEKDVDERQIVALAADEPGPAFATTNAAALYRLVAGQERKGTYTSVPLDAGQVARFGVFRWSGEETGSVKLSFRSGVSAEPDRTWSPWSAAKAGREISLADLPPGRYAQWRAELASAGDGTPRITETELSYRQENLAPKITRFAPLEPGQILVPSNFNPGNQIYEPAHPARDGIFTTLQAADEDGDARWKPLWKKGYRTLRWEASDPNGDALRYALEFRPESGSAWMAMTKDVDEDHYGFDETALPDGIYRFRLLASDAKANADGGSLETEEISEPVVIDSAPPRLAAIHRDGARLRVELEDALSPMREAVVSVDGGEWRPALAEDGLLDGRRETLVVERPPGAKLLLARITDAANNVVTFDLLGSAP